MHHDSQGSQLASYELLASTVFILGVILFGLAAVSLGGVMRARSATAVDQPVYQQVQADALVGDPGDP